MLRATAGLGYRTVRSTDPRLVWKFAYNFGYKGVRSVQRFKKRLRQGVSFPPFLYISITNSCNLRCQGCWVDVDKPQHLISFDEMNRLITSAKAPRQQLLWHPGRRAVYAPGFDPDPEGPSRLLLSDLYKRPSHHRYRRSVRSGRPAMRRRSSASRVASPLVMFAADAAECSTRRWPASKRVCGTGSSPGWRAVSVRAISTILSARRGSTN